MSSKQKKRNPKKNLLWVLLGSVAILIIVLGIIFIDRSSQAAISSLPAEISVSETAKMQDAGAFILDVREPSEWAQGHIEGAVLIPLGELAGRLNEIPKDQRIVVVCRSGNRSARGRELLLNSGFDRVTSMTGGMNQWQAEGNPVITGQ